ncbi:MAG TPA: MFS transporter [Cellvibrio sp.]|nr:MFS transporter [Cellvibrio sp.]
MLDVLKNPTYRNLYLAQVIALMGTGLITIALALLAYDLAKDQAAQVLGIALAIKMIAYITVAPVASAFAERLPRKIVLISLDVVRALTALCLPFVTELWQIYTLIFILQSASAAFTPAFQAVIPDVLPDEKDYTKALSLSRLAYDLENILSPILAGLLLSIVTYNNLFVGTFLGFVFSAFFVMKTTLPIAKRPPFKGVFNRIKQGSRIYFNTPRLKALFALNLAIASASAMVIVNTVVIVQSTFQLSAHATTFAFGAFGLGSMLAALYLPRILEHKSDKTVMISGATLLSMCLFLGAFASSYFLLLLVWLIMGIGYSIAQTPTGRLIRKSARSEDRTALFAAQFTYSHTCWLLTYPLVGWLSSNFGAMFAFIPMAIIAATAIVIAYTIWPKHDDPMVPHLHDNLSPDHEHLLVKDEQGNHIHDYLIDEYHQKWPR